MLTPDGCLILHTSGDTQPIDLSTATRFIPDSEIVFSPSALNLTLSNMLMPPMVNHSRYKELRANGRDDSASAIRLAALKIPSIRLLAILQYQSGWVHGEPTIPPASIIQYHPVPPTRKACIPSFLGCPDA